MATDLGRPNKNFTRWEFTLRDGLTYEDGSPVRAGDVVYAIKRQFADELPGGPTYRLVYFLGGETYDGPYADTNDFEAVETPDDKTIVVKMRKPFPSMRYYASLPEFAPIPPARTLARNTPSIHWRPVRTNSPVTGTARPSPW